MIHKNCSCKKRPSSRWHVHPNTRSVTRGNIFLLLFLICPYVVHTFQVCIAMLAARHPKSTIGNVPALGHLVHWVHGVHCPHRACSDHGEFVRMSCARWVPTPLWAHTCRLHVSRPYSSIQDNHGCWWTAAGEDLIWIAYKQGGSTHFQYQKGK